jgi:hypothetical protein
MSLILAVFQKQFAGTETRADAAGDESGKENR